MRHACCSICCILFSTISVFVVVVVTGAGVWCFCSGMHVSYLTFFVVEKIHTSTEVVFSVFFFFASASFAYILTIKILHSFEQKKKRWLKIDSNHSFDGIILNKKFSKFYFILYSIHLTTYTSFQYYSCYDSCYCYQESSNNDSKQQQWMTFFFLWLIFFLSWTRTKFHL